MEAKSVGHHENYSTPLIERRHENEIPALLSYLATRPLWAGSGIVAEDGYRLCQKDGAVNYCDTGLASLTAHGNKRPIRIQVDRLEIRTGDGNMSPWAIRTKFAMTSLVLRLIEHGQFPDKLIFDPEDLLQHAATTTSINPFQPFEETLRSYNAVTHQAAIARAAQAFASTHHVPREERQAANDIIEITQTLARDQSLIVSSEQIADRVDWAAKWMRLRRRLGIKGMNLSDITTDNLQAVRYDILWEALDARAPGNRYYQSVGNYVDPVAAIAALDRPPNTRAKLRAEYHDVMTYPANTMDWHIITHHDNTVLKLPSPYLGRLGKARKHIASLQRAASSTGSQLTTDQ